MTQALFTLVPGMGDEVLDPQPLARSGWGEQIRGTAVSGLLARSTEFVLRDLARDDLRVARWSVDLFRAARRTQTSTRAVVVREGRRICVVDAVFEQGGRVVARSRATLLARSARPPGQVWSHVRVDPVPPPDLVPVAPEFRLFFTERGGWSHGAAAHQNADRKATWHLPMVLVEGEEPSPLQNVATIADVTNMVVNWGSEGVEYINADLDLVLARLPRSDEVGLIADARLDHDGVSVGTAVMYDRDGSFGVVSITALANGAHAVDVVRRWSSDGLRFD